MCVETISLCVIALNEEKFLPNLLRDLYAQTYPRKKTQIVLVDSGSADCTKSMMMEFAQTHAGEYMGIVVADNPRKKQASGWNVAIANAVCDVIVRIDAHTHIPAEFAMKNMELQRSGEYVTGGVRPCLMENSGAWARTLLEAENSLFGSSINISRRGTEKQYVKTMFHAAYRREVFEKAGTFNEALLRTEDNEMHYRIRQAGYRFCFDPEIVSYQYARGDLKRMVKQKYANGRWIALTLGVCPGCISPFHLVPLAFVMGILLTGVLSVFGFWQLGALMWGAYALVAIAMTVMSAVHSKERSWYFVLLPVLFLLLHISYGAGSVVGVLQMPGWLKNVKDRKAL